MLQVYLCPRHLFHISFERSNQEKGTRERGGGNVPSCERLSQATSKLVVQSKQGSIVHCRSSCRFRMHLAVLTFLIVVFVEGGGLRY